MRRRSLLIGGLVSGLAGPAMAEASPLHVAAREAFLYALSNRAQIRLRGRPSAASVRFAAGGRAAGS